METEKRITVLILKKYQKHRAGRTINLPASEAIKLCEDGIARLHDPETKPWGPSETKPIEPSEIKRVKKKSRSLMDSKS